MIKRTVRGATKHAYKRIAKPLLFKQHPDGVHRRLVKVAKITQKTPGIRRLPKLWAYQSPLLEQDLLGNHFKNPVGLSAGFDKNIDIRRGYLILCHLQCPWQRPTPGRQ